LSVKPYKPSGIVPTNGLLTLFARVVIAAVIAGGFLWFMNYVFRFYLVAIFPMIAGGILILGVMSGIQSGKIRNPLVAGLIGALGTVFAFGLSHYLAYEVSFKNTARAAYASQGPTPTPTELQILTDAYLNKQVNSEGFVGFLKLEAEQGFTTTTLGSSVGTESKGGSAWFSFILEVLIAGFIVTLMGAHAAREPFDERTQTWFGQSIYLGGAAGDDGTALADALKGGAFEQAGGFVRPARVELGLPRVELHAKLSPDANAEHAVLEVKALTPGEKQNTHSTKTLITGLITREELMRLKPQTV
jgi:hypothetical protein